MTCPDICPLEQATRDTASPGPVGAGELIARAAFSPSAGEAQKRKIRTGLVARRDLFADQLSVWRLAGVSPLIPLSDLIDRMIAEQGDRRLFAVVWAEASQIRKLQRPSDGSRALCLLDECTCDQVGGKHPAHAHIAICQSIRSQPSFNGESEDFIQICRDLSHLLQSDPLRRQDVI